MNEESKDLNVTNKNRKNKKNRRMNDKEVMKLYSDIFDTNKPHTLEKQNNIYQNIGILEKKLNDNNFNTQKKC